MTSVAFASPIRHVGCTLGRHHVYAHRDLRSAARPSPSGGVLCRPCRASSVRKRQTPRRERPRFWFRLRLRGYIGVAHALVPAADICAPEWAMNASRIRCESLRDARDCSMSVLGHHVRQDGAVLGAVKASLVRTTATMFRVRRRALTAPARRAVRWHLRDGRRCEWLTLTRDFEQA